jgi:uncharacterized spore protein YtfJ
MPLVIDLPDAIEQRLEDEARRTGVSVQDIAVRIIKEKYPSAHIVDTEEQKRLNQSSIDLIQSWLNAPKTPEEKEEAEKGFEEFKRNMNETRKIAGARLLYPENK